MRNSDEAGEISFVEAPGAKLAIFVEGERKKIPCSSFMAVPECQTTSQIWLKSSLGGIKCSDTFSVRRED